MKIVHVACVVFSCVSAFATASFGQFRLNTVSYNVDVAASVNGAEQRVTTSDFQQSDGRASLQADFTRSLGQNSATAYLSAFADVGTLGVQVTGAAFADRVLGDTTAAGARSTVSVGARIQDTWVMEGPNVAPGTEYIAIGHFNLNGSVNASIGPSIFAHSAEVVMTLSGNGLPPSPYPFGVFANAYSSLSGSYQHNPPVVVSYSPTITAGVAFTFDIQLSVIGEAIASDAAFDGSSSAFYDGDFSHTLTWGGITSVMNAETGEVVEGWTITSASGFNYANPVPEPSTVTLLGGGLCLLALTACRRRKAA